MNYYFIVIRKNLLISRLRCCEFVVGMILFVWVTVQPEVKRLQIGAKHPCVRSASRICLESFERLYRQNLLCLNGLLEVIVCQDFTEGHRLWA